MLRSLVRRGVVGSAKLREKRGRTLHTSMAAACNAKTGQISSEYPTVDHTFDAVVVGAGKIDVFEICNDSFWYFLHFLYLQAYVLI